MRGDDVHTSSYETGACKQENLGGLKSDYALAGPITRQNGTNSLEKYLEIGAHSLPADVTQIPDNLAPHTLDRIIVAIVHLRKTSDARLDQKALRIVRDFRLQDLDEEGALGTRPDERHVAANDIEKLWNLVEARLAQ